MDHNGGGSGLHGLVAGRSGSGSRRVDWREARDLGLLLVVAIAAPLAAMAAQFGAGRAAVLTPVALATGAGLWMVRVLRREYALSWNLTESWLALAFCLSPTKARAASTRWRTAALRLIPERHQGNSSSPAVRVSARGTRGGSSRPGRQNPGA